MVVTPERVYERLVTHAERDEDSGCLVSLYSVGSHGYAQIGWWEEGRTRVTVAHRAHWIYVNGAIPDGMVVDHQCHNRRCIELSHLRLLSNFENARRTSGRDWPLGECVNGHPNSELTTVSGKAGCRICREDTQVRARQRRKEASAA